VLVGGGLGRQPIIGHVIREFLPRRHLLSYLEAVMRIYNELGRRDNLNKARIKILVKSLGVEEFRRRVEEEWGHIRDGALELGAAELAPRCALASRPAYETLTDTSVSALGDVRFKAWYRYNTHAHKIPGYRAVFISLKAHGEAPGDMTAKQMDAVAA